jgi:hypothetical protein
MTAPAVNLPLPIIAPEVRAFAAEKGVAPHLPVVVELARRAFPSSPLLVTVGQDAEDESHRYIALDVEVGGLDAEEPLAGQQVWSSGLFTACPARCAVYFVLGWR